MTLLFLLLSLHSFLPSFPLSSLSFKNVETEPHQSDSPVCDDIHVGSCHADFHPGFLSKCKEHIKGDLDDTLMDAKKVDSPEKMIVVVVCILLFEIINPDSNFLEDLSKTVRLSHFPRK